MESSKKNVYIIFGIIAVLILIISLSFLFKKDKMSDAERFAKEYDFTVNNVFVYRNLDEINKILENGTGVVYLGFPECPWCRGYIPYLNEVAINEHLDKIYYSKLDEGDKEHIKSYNSYIRKLIKMFKLFNAYCTFSIINCDNDTDLDYKDAPVDKGKDVFCKLYQNRIIIEDVEELEECLIK